MTYSREELRAELQRDEGMKLKPYYDTATPPRLSIGVGRNLDDVGMSAAEVVMLEDNDIDRAERGLDTVVLGWRSFSNARQKALLNMCFNMGPGKLAEFHRMITALHSGDWPTAAAEMKNSAWARQVGDRAVRLEAMMLNG